MGRELWSYFWWVRKLFLTIYSLKCPPPLSPYMWLLATSTIKQIHNSKTNLTTKRPTEQAAGNNAGCEYMQADRAPISVYTITGDFALGKEGAGKTAERRGTLSMHQSCGLECRRELGLVRDCTRNLPGLPTHWLKCSLRQILDFCRTTENCPQQRTESKLPKNCHCHESYGNGKWQNVGRGVGVG